VEKVASYSPATSLALEGPRGSPRLMDTTDHLCGRLLRACATWGMFGSSMSDKAPGMQQWREKVKASIALYSRRAGHHFG